MCTGCTLCRRQNSSFQGLEEASSEETIAPCCFAHVKEMMLILGILEDRGLLLVLQHIRGCFHAPLHPTILLQTGERSHSQVSGQFGDGQHQFSAIQKIPSLLMLQHVTFPH